MAHDLTEKQKAFVEELIRNGGNRTRAALAVYDTTDYQTAGQIAFENMKKPEVRRYLAELSEAGTLTAREILRLHSEIVQADIGSAIDPRGELNIGALVASGQTRYVKAISQEETRHGGRLRVEFYDKQRSLEALGKAYGLDRQVVEHEADDKLSELLKGLTAPWAKREGQ